MKRCLDNSIVKTIAKWAKCSYVPNFTGTYRYVSYKHKTGNRAVANFQAHCTSTLVKDS